MQRLLAWLLAEVFFVQWAKNNPLEPLVSDLGIIGLRGTPTQQRAISYAAPVTLQRCGLPIVHRPPRPDMAPTDLPGTDHPKSTAGGLRSEV